MKRTRCLATILVTATLLTGVSLTHAAEEVVPRIQIDGVPLCDVIRNLARQFDLNCIIDPTIPGSSFGPGRSVKEPTVTVLWTDMAPRAALLLLLKEHKLTLVTNPVTTVARIAPVSLNVKPVLASQLGTNVGTVIPVIRLESVPLTECIKQLGTVAGLTITLDGQVAALDPEGSVSISWQRLTARQALAAVLDNYGLRLIEDTATAKAVVSIQPKTDKEKKPPGRP